MNWGRGGCPTEARWGEAGKAAKRQAGGREKLPPPPTRGEIN